MAKSAATIEQARDALAREAWPDAYEILRALDPSELTASDLEGLADAAWWLSHLRESLDLRHQAYAAYVAEADERGAGAVAARLAIEHFVRDEPSVGSGFLMRAHRHLQPLPDGPERGYMAMLDATVAYFSGELDAALETIIRGREIAERFHDPDLIAMAIHTEGLIRLDLGQVADGLALMDEAMASVIAGDLSAYFTGIIYCSLIDACLELSDLRRAGEWSDAAQAWCDALPEGSSFPGVCRANRAQLARLRGAWAEAEAGAALAAGNFFRSSQGWPGRRSGRSGRYGFGWAIWPLPMRPSLAPTSWGSTRSPGSRSCGSGRGKPRRRGRRSERRSRANARGRSARGCWRRRWSSRRRTTTPRRRPRGPASSRRWRRPAPRSIWRWPRARRDRCRSRRATWGRRSRRSAARAPPGRT